jgi:hypothetical protein
LTQRTATKIFRSPYRADSTIDSAALSAARDAIDRFCLLISEDGAIYARRGVRLVKVCPEALRDFARARLGRGRRGYRDLRAAILLLAARDGR